MSSYPKTSTLMQRVSGFPGCAKAILCGAMNRVTESNLVSAISNAGGFRLIAWR